MPSARPSHNSWVRFMTFPISALEVAPVSWIACATNSVICASLRAAGRYLVRMAISAFSVSASSWRLAFSNCSMESWRCLICLRTTARISGSSNSVPSPPFSIAALVKALLRARRELSAMESLARMAVLISSEIWSAELLMRH